jgi:hypothetical protein
VIDVPDRSRRSSRRQSPDGDRSSSAIFADAGEIELGGVAAVEGFGEPSSPWPARRW